MKTGRNYKFWFCTGSQDLYGDECLRKVAEHSRIIVEELNKRDRKSTRLNSSHPSSSRMPSSA